MFLVLTILLAADVRCGDAFAGQAGTLSEEARLCLVELASEAGHESQEAASELLLADAVARGDLESWTFLAWTHGTEVTEDPDLLLQLSTYYEALDQHEDVVRVATAALDRRAPWPPREHCDKGYQLHQLRAEAANRLWDAANATLVYSTGPDREEAAVLETEMRDVAKETSRAWLDHAGACDLPWRKPTQLCVAASGTKQACRLH